MSTKSVLHKLIVLSVSAAVAVGAAGGGARAWAAAEAPAAPAATQPAASPASSAAAAAAAATEADDPDAIVTDAGQPDAGQPDAGQPDAGPADGERTDAEQPAAGPTDNAPSDSTAPGGRRRGAGRSGATPTDGPAAPASLAPFPRGRSRRLEMAVRSLMLQTGFPEIPLQDAIIAHMTGENRARGPLRAKSEQLFLALQSPRVTDAQLTDLLQGFQKALDDDRTRRLQSEADLDARIGFSKNARLQSALLLFGIIGDGALFVPLREPPRPAPRQPAGADAAALQPTPPNAPPVTGVAATATVAAVSTTDQPATADNGTTGANAYPTRRASPYDAPPRTAEPPASR